jgi:hypothetical protein
VTSSRLFDDTASARSVEQAPAGLVGRDGDLHPAGGLQWGLGIQHRRAGPRYWLSLLGASPDGFFRSLTYTYSHDNAIMAVARRIVIAEPDVLDFHRKSLRAVTNYGRTHKLEIRLRFKLKTRDYFSDFQTGLRQVPSQFGSALHPAAADPHPPFFRVACHGRG